LLRRASPGFALFLFPFESFLCRPTQIVVFSGEDFPLLPPFRIFLSFLTRYFPFLTLPFLNFRQLGFWPATWDSPIGRDYSGSKHPTDFFNTLPPDFQVEHPSSCSLSDQLAQRFVLEMLYRKNVAEPLLFYHTTSS